MKEYIAELLEWGANLQYTDGVVLGFIFLAYILTISWIEHETICKRFVQNGIDKSLIVFFIVTFFSIFIQNTVLMDIIHHKYPFFLSIFELIKYIEIFIFMTFVVIFIIGFIVYIFSIIGINGILILIASMLVYIVLGYITLDLLHMKYFISFDLFIKFILCIVFLYILKQSIQYLQHQLPFFFKNLYANIVCLLRKDYE